MDEDESRNLLPDPHGLLVVVAEEVVGFVRPHGFPAVHAQVEHCKANTCGLKWAGPQGATPRRLCGGPPLVGTPTQLR